MKTAPQITAGATDALVQIVAFAERMLKKSSLHRPTYSIPPRRDQGPLAPLSHKNKRVVSFLVPNTSW